MVERAIGGPKPKNPHRRANAELRGHKLPDSRSVRIDERGIEHKVSGPLGSTFTEEPPVWTLTTIGVAKPAETVELESIKPHALTSIEVYVLAFALYMANIIKDEDQLREVGLRLNQEELYKLHTLIRPESERRAKPIPAFDLDTIIAQIKGKLANFVAERGDFWRDNESEVRTRLLMILERFGNQQFLDRALEFMFRPLEELQMAEYFRGENGASPHS